MVDRGLGNHRLRFDVAKQVNDASMSMLDWAVLTRSLTKTLRDGVGGALSPETLVRMLWGRARTNWHTERRLRCGLRCSSRGGHRFKSCPRYQRVSGTTAGQRPASSACGPLSCPGEVCVLTKPLTRTVSGVPPRLSGMRCTWTLERDQHRPGPLRRRSPGRFPGGRRRVRQTGGLARGGDRILASTHVLGRSDRRPTPRRPKVRLLLAPGPIAR